MDAVAKTQVTWEAFSLVQAREWSQCSSIERTDAAQNQCSWPVDHEGSMGNDALQVSKSFIKQVCSG